MALDRHGRAHIDGFAERLKAGLLHFEPVDAKGKKLDGECPAGIAVKRLVVAGAERDDLDLSAQSCSGCVSDFEPHLTVVGLRCSNRDAEAEQDARRAAASRRGFIGSISSQ